MYFASLINTRLNYGFGSYKNRSTSIMFFFSFFSFFCEKLNLKKIWAAI